MTSHSLSHPAVAGDAGPWLRAVAVRAALDTAYLSLGLLTSVAALALWIAGVTLTVSLAVFLVGLPVFVGTAVAFHWATDLDRRTAALVLGRGLRSPHRDHRGQGFGTRLRTTCTDPQTWKDLAWLVAHSVTGFAFGVAAISLVVSTVGLALLPAWYWAIPDGVQLGLWTVDSLPLALASALLAVPCAVLTVALLRPMALAEGAMAAGLLGGGDAEARAR